MEEKSKKLLWLWIIFCLLKASLIRGQGDQKGAKGDRGEPAKGPPGLPGSPGLENTGSAQGYPGERGPDGEDVVVSLEDFIHLVLRQQWLEHSDIEILPSDYYLELETPLR